MLNLLPRDEKYFDRFSDMARRIHEGARILNTFFDGQAPVAPVADQIKRLEHECDEISHEILRGIDRTFITPIDREDVHQLAVRLDDVIDLIEEPAPPGALPISEPALFPGNSPRRSSDHPGDGGGQWRAARGQKEVVGLHPDETAREPGDVAIRGVRPSSPNRSRRSKS
jgi:hypothetical protein